jgi:septum formation protein
MTTPRLVLASGSPRRQELLREARYRFDVRPAEVDESDVPAGLSPEEVASHLAEKKAAAAAELNPDAVVLAADTVVALDTQALGKPEDAGHARRMLAGLSGTIHRVITGVVVMRKSAGFRRGVLVTSTVQMRTLSSAEIDAYVATGSWEGKAGGYGIQDKDPFVTRMTGSLTNIVGLPMEAAAELLRAAGVEPEKP